MKDNLIVRLRNETSEQAVHWMDACLRIGAMLDEAPLLGSGGNDGSRDFGVNFAERLKEVFDIETGEASGASRLSLESSLFATAVCDLRRDTMGQFAPGQGGPNAGIGFSAAAPLNPWDFIMAVEGCILFGGAVTRRFGTLGKIRAAFPFTFDVVYAGTGALSAADPTHPRGEIWVPIWERPVGLSELAALFSEGRVTLGREIARDGLDVVRAVKAFGSQRGIAAYQRYALVQPDKKMPYQATPVGRVSTTRNPTADLIADLASREAGNWLMRFREVVRGRRSDMKDPPARARTIGRRLEDALFALAQRKDDPRAGQEVLLALGAATLYLRSHLKLHDPASNAYVPPPPRLRGAWVRAADDGSAEFRIAVALAALGWGRPDGNGGPDEPAAVDDAGGGEPDERGDAAPAAEAERAPRLRLPFCVHLAALDQERVFGPRRRWNRERAAGVADGSALVVWGGGDLVANLIAVLDRRLLEAARHGLDDKPLAGRIGADLAAIGAFLAGPPAFDDQRCAALLAGLAWAAPPSWLAVRKRPGHELPGVPFAYAALKPIFTPDAELRCPDPDDRHARRAGWHGVLLLGGRLPVPPALPRLLAVGRVDEALTLGLARARAAALSVAFTRRRATPGRPWFTAPEPRRLAAAMLIPIECGALKTLVERAYPV